MVSFNLVALIDGLFTKWGCIVNFALKQDVGHEFKQSKKLLASTKLISQQTFKHFEGLVG